MKPVVYAKSNIETYYENNSLFSRIKDRFKINLIDESFVQELNLRITHLEIPPNFNKTAYLRNINYASTFIKNRKVSLAPKTLRRMDYYLFNRFQKELFAYGIMKSIQLILRIKNKSIKNSCIVIYDACDDINKEIICMLAKNAKYMIFLSDNIKKNLNLGEYVVANYGISPIITQDKQYAFKNSDFIVSSRKIEINKNTPIWYFDNGYVPGNVLYSVNDVSYVTPWNIQGDVTTELLGAILSQMDEKDVEVSLKYNGIYLDKIKFNDNVLDINAINNNR